MNELPSYPTPRQAAYVVPGSNGNSTTPGSRKKSGHSQQNVMYRPPTSSQPQYSSSPQPYQSVPPQSHQSRPQPVQQVHFPQQQPAPSNQYYQQQQQQQQQPQAYSQPLVQPNYYNQPNSLPLAPAPQQAYYQQSNTSASAPPAPVQQHYQQPPPPAPGQTHHSHSPHQQYQSTNAPPVPQPQQQRYGSNGNRKPSNPNNGYTGSRESLPEPTPPKQSSKQKLESELRSVFDKVDTSRSGRISKSELSNALLNFDHTKFQESTVVLMINLFSNPSSASKHLNFDQFVSLWKYLSAYKKLFVQADTNNSGDISFGEFQKVLEQIGYKLNIDLVLHLFQKFSYKDYDDTDGSSVGKLKFDKFIELLVYLRKLTDIFKKYDKDLSGVATINFSDFLFEVSNLN